MWWAFLPSFGAVCFVVSGRGYTIYIELIAFAVNIVIAVAGSLVSPRRTGELVPQAGIRLVDPRPRRALDPSTRLPAGGEETPFVSA